MSAPNRDDTLVWDKDLLFDHCDFVERVCWGNDESSGWFLLFSHRVAVVGPDGYQPNAPNGMTWGEEVVAYACSSSGVVADWNKRYEIRAHSYQSAVRKLHYQWINGLAWLAKPPWGEGNDE